MVSHEEHEQLKGEHKELKDRMDSMQEQLTAVWAVIKQLQQQQDR